MSLDWHGEAELCVKKILLQVPIGFRQSARIRITERAEILAAECGLITVDIDHAVQALAQATPTFQHQSIDIALKELDIETGNLFHQEIE